jgi:hypothetical protein
MKTAIAERPRSRPGLASSPALAALDEDQRRSYHEVLGDVKLMLDGTGRMPLVEAAGERVMRTYRKALAAKGKTDRHWRAYFEAVAALLSQLPYDLGRDDAVLARSRLLTFVRDNPDLGG